MFRGRMGERRGVEAGPSTLVPPPALYGGLPAPQPSGWTPETTADAEQHNTITEDNKVAVSDFTVLMFLVQLYVHPASDAHTDQIWSCSITTSRVSREEGGRSQDVQMGGATLGP